MKMLDRLATWWLIRRHKLVSLKPRDLTVMPGYEDEVMSE